MNYPNGILNAALNVSAMVRYQCHMSKSNKDNPRVEAEVIEL